MTPPRKGPPPIPRAAEGDEIPAPFADGDPDVGDATELTTGDQTELTQADATELNYRPSTTAIHRPSFADLGGRTDTHVNVDATLDEGAVDATLDEEPASPFDDDAT